MIIDEPIVMSIPPMQVSCGGDFIQVTSMEMTPPSPSMAKDTFKMRKYFTKIQKEGMQALSALAGQDELRQQVEEQKALELQAGDPVEKLHEEYADNAPDKKQKLADLEKTVAGFSELIGLCEEVDLYQMTVDFRKLLISNTRCVLIQDPKDGQGREPLSAHVWENQIDPQDRLNAAVRYCCFFGLISNMIG